MQRTKTMDHRKMYAMQIYANKQYIDVLWFTDGSNAKKKIQQQTFSVDAHYHSVVKISFYKIQPGEKHTTIIPISNFMRKKTKT